MNKLNIPNPSNGLRLYWEDLEYTLGYGAYDSGLLQAIESILKAYGEDFIVSGCEDLGSNVTAAGWVMLGSTLIKVDQHTRLNSYFVATYETNTTGDRTDNLSTLVNIYNQTKAECTGGTGNLPYNGIRLNEILGLNISTLAIAANGIYTVDDNEKIITVNSSASSSTTINLPTPSTYNKGNAYVFHMSYNGSGALSIVGESGTLKSYPGVNVNGVVSFKNDGTTWRLENEVLTANKSVEGVITLAATLDYFALTNGTRAMTPTDVGNAIKSESITYTTAGTKSLGLNVGVVKITVTEVDINLPQTNGKRQEILVYYPDLSATPADSIINYSTDGITWNLLVNINVSADLKLYRFVNDGTTWRWTIEDYVEQP